MVVGAEIPDHGHEARPLGAACPLSLPQHLIPQGLAELVGGHRGGADRGRYKSCIGRERQGVRAAPRLRAALGEPRPTVGMALGWGASAGPEP
jgi:hypothetical protein